DNFTKPLDRGPGHWPRKKTGEGKSAAVLAANGKPQDDLWHKYEAKAYWIIFRRLPGEPDRIHPIGIGEPEKRRCPGPPGHRRSRGVTPSPAAGRGGWWSSPA